MIATSPPDINEMTDSMYESKANYLTYCLYIVSIVSANLPVDPHPQMNTRFLLYKVSNIFK